MQQEVSLKQPPRKEVKFVSRSGDGGLANLDASYLPPTRLYFLSLSFCKAQQVQFYVLLVMLILPFSQKKREKSPWIILLT